MIMTNEHPAAWWDVLEERQRQMLREGFTAAHDDPFVNSELARAAAAYAITDWGSPPGILPLWWPWSPEWWKPRDRRRNLVRAAALLLAEIERIDRAASRGG